MAMTSETDDPQRGQPFGAPAVGTPQSYGGPSVGDAPTSELVAAAVSDRCVTCGAPLASDQRYCIECGGRRGKPRFPLTNTASASSAPRAPRRRLPRPRTTAGGTLVAGIGTLLLAMGVGVEIGHNTGSSVTTPAQRQAPPEVITVNAGGAAPTSTTASRVKTPKVKAKITKKVAAKGSAAAAKTLGASAKNLAPPTVKPGGKCTHGAGCQNGTFTGNFFGP
jgi:hypothetical protein